ncbi:MAG TPA: SIMPL domain-containing protein [Thiohalobacter sp.]|nr:SIMPL domain-containing protein [Thiohalobacter sp.]
MMKFQRWFALLLLVPALPLAAAEDNHYNRIRFQVEVSERVANDRMQAVLAAEVEAASADEVAGNINRTMRWALDQSRDIGGITVSTGSYRITPVYRKDRPERWRGLQELRLEGSDFAALGQLIGVLQQRLQIKHTGFFIAAATREAVETRLINQAIERFQQRAGQIRQRFGAETFHLVEASVNAAGGGQPQPLLRMQAMAEAAPPALEGGEGEVAVSVSGVIELE